MSEVVKYQAQGREVALNHDIVRKYLAIGDRITDKEIEQFIRLCQYRQINPFLREAYLVKYGNNPAVIVTGKDYFLRTAVEHPKFKGFKAGIIFRHGDKIDRREGSFLAPGEELLGGWSIVWREGCEPFEHTVSLREYEKYFLNPDTSRWELTHAWKNMPATMIRKVALVQNLREAYPELFGGLYSQEEMISHNVKLPENEVVIEEGEPEAVEGNEEENEEEKADEKYVEDEEIVEEIPLQNEETPVLHHVLGDIENPDAVPPKTKEAKYNAYLHGLLRDYSRAINMRMADVKLIVKHWCRDRHIPEIGRTYKEWSELLTWAEGLAKKKKKLDPEKNNATDDEPEMDIMEVILEED